jgi:hypothetical protein
MDPRTPGILSATGKLICYDGEMGFMIMHQVRASMKSSLYDVMVSFTRKGIIACSCTCKAGSQGVERVVCVHILPVIFQMTLLMHDGLANHCLYELATEWHASMDNAFSHDTQSKMVESIKLIQQSAGEQTPSSTKKQKISEMLHPYTVGTENRTLEPPPPKDTSKLGPLRQLNLMSPLKKASELICKKSAVENGLSSGCTATGSDENSENSSAMADSGHLPNYKRIQDAIYVIQVLLSSADTETFAETIGHWL